MDRVRAIRLPEKGSMTACHKLGNVFFSTLATILHKKTSDLLTGMFAINKKRFQKLGLKSKGFEIETEIFIKSVKNKLSIKEMPIKYFPRRGETKINTFGDGIKILKKMLLE